MGKHSHRDRSESSGRRHKRSKHDKNRSRSRERAPRGSEDRSSRISEASRHTPPPRTPSPDGSNAALLQSILTHLERQEKRLATIEVNLPAMHVVEPPNLSIPPTDGDLQGVNGDENVTGRQTKYGTVLRNRGCEPGVSSC